jgi:thioredoxin reductase
MSWLRLFLLVFCGLKRDVICRSTILPKTSHPRLIRDVAIIGGGPAGETPRPDCRRSNHARIGYTAALYASRALLKPLLISGYSNGGQLTLTSEVENFPGYPSGVSGPTLMEDLRSQAIRFGSEIWETDCESIDFSSSPYQIHLPNCTVSAKSIILATGAQSLWLEAENEQNYKGLGISTCATCDGPLFANEDVIVVGGGDAAMEEALFLTKFAKSVTVLNRSSKLRASKVSIPPLPLPLCILSHHLRSCNKEHKQTRKFVF